VEFVQSLSLLALHLSRWAEEMILFSTQEYGFISLPEAYSTGSSAMPQKKNADLLELVRGKAGRIVGAATTLLVSMKGLPLAYNKDMQETQEPLFDAAQTILSIMPLVAGWMKGAEFDFARMQQAASAGSMNAWAAATYLVERGVPSRLAHEAVGKAVKVCLERGCELQDLSVQDLRQIHPAFDDDVYRALSLESVLAIHNVEGGTAPAQVQAALQRAEQRIAHLRGEVHAHA
jgi:argininosuccinate lyase